MKDIKYTKASTQAITQIVAYNIGGYLLIIL